MFPRVLEMRGIRKVFPGVVALDDVRFELGRGEVHALLGENGAGKSTLMKILSGACRSDAGEILIDGRPATLGSPRDAQRLGISTIYQEFNLVPHLSAAENIFLGREPMLKRFGLVIDRRTLVARARQLLESLGTAVDPGAPVRSLGVAEQQMVEIAKALSIRARVLIMDEPTSALTASEIDQLFAAIRRFTGEGGSVIYISHRLEELARVGHRATVLRDGRYVGTRLLPAPIPELVRMMVESGHLRALSAADATTRRGDPARRGSGARHTTPRRQLHASPGRGARRGRAPRRRPDRARSRDCRRGSAGRRADYHQRHRGSPAQSPRRDSRPASVSFRKIENSRVSCCRRALPRISRCRSCRGSAARDVVSRTRERALASRWTSRAPHPNPRHRYARRDAERREPAEGGPRQVAGARRRRLDRRRADARHRRRRQDGDLHAAGSRWRPAAQAS